MKNKSSKIPKIYCIGSNLESFRTLNYLIKNNCIIDTLITLPRGNNNNVSDYYDLHDFCSDHKIKIIDTTNVNSEHTLAKISSENPDYLFTLGWSQIFKEDFIKCFKKFIIGTHPSKLPYGRGRAPLPWTILENLKTSAVSFFKIDTGVDTGKLIFQREFEIRQGLYVNELYDIVSKELSLGFLNIYQTIVRGETFSLVEQAKDGITLRGKRVPSDGLIEFQNSIYDTERLIRAVSNPYPGAYCYYRDTKVIFWRVKFEGSNMYKGTIGQILSKKENGILVQFKDGVLWLMEPTDQSGTALDRKFFRLGDKLGYSMQDEIYYIRKMSNK